MGSTDNMNIFLNEERIGLESYKVCIKAMLSNSPMEVCTLYFGATILLLDITKIINNKFPLTSLNIKLWVSKISLATVKFHVK